MNPYAKDLGDRDPLVSLTDTPARLARLVEGFSAEDFERAYAPGKWPVRLVLVHLAQVELIVQTRVRLALTQHAYTVQPFDQDHLMAVESGSDGPTAFGAYSALRAFSLPLFRSLTPAQLDRGCTHPDFGPITVRWFLEMLAGHELRHLGQIREVGSRK